METGAASNFLVLTKNSNQGYKSLHEDSALKYDASDNNLYVDNLDVSGTIIPSKVTGNTVSETITQADTVKIDDAPDDTSNYLVFTKNSTAGKDFMNRQA